MKAVSIKRHWWLLGAGLALLIILATTLLLFFAPETIRLLRRDTTWRTMQANGVWRVGMDPSFPPLNGWTTLANQLALMLH